MPIGLVADTEHDHNRTKARGPGPAKPQPVVSGRAVIPTDVASLGKLTDTIRGKDRQYGSNEEAKHE